MDTNISPKTIDLVFHNDIKNEISIDYIRLKISFDNYNFKVKIVNEYTMEKNKAIIIRNAVAVKEYAIMEDANNKFRPYMEDSNHQFIQLHSYMIHS